MTIWLIFQMACILRPECNFLNGYFRCLLPVETVDVEVKVNTMRGTNTFRRDRTSQIIKCNPWTTKLYPYSCLIQKMKMYLELEGKLGPKPRPQLQTQLQPTLPQPSTSAHPQNNNPMTRKALRPKISDKRRRTMLTKRSYKVRVIAKPIPTTPSPTTPVNSTAPTPTIATASTQTPMVNSAAMSILVTVWQKESSVKFLTQQEDPKPKESLPFITPTHNHLHTYSMSQSEKPPPWPSTGSASKNLFEARIDWPIPLYTCTQCKNRSTTPGSSDPPCNGYAQTSCRKITWRPHSPICKNEEEHGEKGWNSDRQKEQPRNQCPQYTQHSQSQNTQHPQSFDVPERYSEQIRLRSEWEEKMECLNEKYNLDYYSSSEPDSYFELEHKYEMLI